MATYRHFMKQILNKINFIYTVYVKQVFLYTNSLNNRLGGIARKNDPEVIPTCVTVVTVGKQAVYGTTELYTQQPV